MVWIRAAESRGAKRPREGKGKCVRGDPEKQIRLLLDTHPQLLNTDKPYPTTPGLQWLTVNAFHAKGVTLTGL